MADNEIEPSSRGPLKYSVKTPAPQLEAGRKISVELLITNPYEVPVTILITETVLPAHFEDANKPSSFFGTIWASARDSAERELDGADTLQVVSGKNVLVSGEASPETLAEQIVVLQPGNTAVRAFTLRTKQSLLFTPSVHSLNAQVCYQIENGERQYDSVSYQLNIRAPFKALIIGSMFGALIGTVVRYNTPPPSDEAFELAYFTPFLVALATNILIGGVLVIAFARKKDAQPFITVEDFWGGFFIGFVAGYIGEGMIDGAVRGIGGTSSR